MKLPVRMWGMDLTGNIFDVEAAVIGITGVGARITGVSFPLQRGAVVGVQCGHRRTGCRIAWIGEPGTPLAGQLGVECVEEGQHPAINRP